MPKDLPEKQAESPKVTNQTKPALAVTLVGSKAPEQPKGFNDININIKPEGAKNEWFFAPIITSGTLQRDIKDTELVNLFPVSLILWDSARQKKLGGTVSVEAVLSATAGRLVLIEIPTRIK